MQTLRQISRFGLVGIIATAVHVGVGLGLHEGADLRPLWANLIAFGCALGVVSRSSAKPGLSHSHSVEQV